MLLELDGQHGQHWGQVPACVAACRVRCDGDMAEVAAVPWLQRHVPLASAAYIRIGCALILHLRSTVQMLNAGVQFLAAFITL